MKSHSPKTIVILSIGFFLLLIINEISFSDNNQNQTASLMDSESPPPFMEYQVYNNTIIEDSEPLPVLPGGWGDYSALFDKYNLCDLVANDTIDEIWIWAGNGDGVTLGHLLEWTTSGPGWTGMTPNCGEVVTTMVYNYTRDVNLHAYAHRMEGLMRHYQPCDFSTATWPWNAVGDSSGDFTHCGDLLSNVYGFVARPFAENNQIAGCGDVHFPPNMIQGDSREYIYHEFRSVDSICPDWSMDGSAISTTLNCQNWGCSEYGYMIWWLQNFPGYNNTNRNRNGTYQPNWWAYLFDEKFVITPTPTFTATATATQTPTNTATATNTPTNTATATNTPTSTVITTQISTTSVSQTPTNTATATPTNTAIATPTPYHLFLSSIIKPKIQLSTLPNQHISTLPGDPPFAPMLSNTIHLTSNTFTAQEAIIKPVVFVINLTAYEVNGTPINDVEILNNQMIAAAREATIYHGYLFNPYLQATFLGQDGESFAGTGCSTGTVPDNVHIHLSGIKLDVIPTSYRVNDPAAGGVWATPCNPVSNWLLYVDESTPGEADIYFKPFRDAPDGTIYSISINYADGSTQTVTVLGSHVSP